MSHDSAAAVEQPSLYAAHQKVQPKSVKGPHRRVKWAVLIVMLIGYYVMPWLRWDRGPGISDQAVLFDFDGRRFFMFNIEIWPQQIYYITFLLILAAVVLFLTTALWGRLWCGYACPQTLWTDLYMLVERWIEGDRNERIRRDRAPMTASTFFLKLGKHVVWLLIALTTGGWFIFYFYDAPTLVHDITSGAVSGTTVAIIGILTMMTYFLAGFLREHTCTYMCPWPRFQSAMQDEESLIVTYRAWRGEGRGPLRKSVSWEQRKAQGLGDCIDCGVCQQVCPTGIDIRDGSQLQCIGCALCIDACNDIMKRIGRPKGLIAFDTHNAQVACASGKAPQYRLLRPRTVLYMALLLAIGVFMVTLYSERALVHVSLLRDRAPLFVRLTGGEIMNGFTFKISNLTREAHQYTVTLEGIPGARMVSSGVDETPVTTLHLAAVPDAVATFRVTVRAPKDVLAGASTPLRFVVMSETASINDKYDTSFMGPQ
ncbi:MAG: cytochrome c oxidase accessory protein CcoG [Rhodospirillaceae bacterium]